MKKETPNRKWYLVDAKGKILGRLATKIANLLRGKEKPNFVPYLDMGDNVVVINASQIRVTGKKLDQKIYYRHTGYLGGIKQETFKELLKRKPEEIIRKAVSGMLPNNRLKKFWLKKLYIYKGQEHSLKEKLEQIDG